MIQHLRFCTLILFSLAITNGFSQAITIAFGPIFTKTNAIQPVVNGKEDFSNTDYCFSMSYEQFFKNKKYSAFATYSKYDGCTFIYFQEGGWIAGGGVSLARGFCGGVDLHRFDLGFSYLLTNPDKRFYFRPYLVTGIQSSKKTGVDFWREGLPIEGPDYFELEPMSAEPQNTVQIVPSMGMHTGFVFWKRLDIGLNIQGVYAFKSYQKMYLKYQYKGEIQPTAEYESTGTGLFVSLGIGYRFAKWIR